MVVEPHRNRTGEAVEIVMGDGHLSSGGAGHAEVKTAGNGHHNDAVEAAAVAVLLAEEPATHSSRNRKPKPSSFSPFE